jgi:hypothetical protein
LVQEADHEEKFAKQLLEAVDQKRTLEVVEGYAASACQLLFRQYLSWK